jgi:putative dehydrogenase
MHDETAKRPRVGLIGLGAMGRGMALSLRAAGFELGVVDARPGVAEEFAAEGGTVYETAAELAAEVDVLVSVVVNAAQVEQVLSARRERPRRCLLARCS